MKFALFFVLLLPTLYGIQNQWEQLRKSDSRWANVTFPNSTDVINSERGTIIVSLSQIFVTWKIGCSGFPCYPNTLMEWLIKNGGFYGPNLRWNALQKLGLKWLGCSMDSKQWDAWLKSGRPVLFRLGMTSEYWVLGLSMYSSNSVWYTEDLRDWTREISSIPEACGFTLVSPTK